jgi:hypothetical protein
MRGQSLLVVVIMLSLSGCASGGRPTPEQLANNTFSECPSNYQEMIRQRLKANLIDPYSAMFRFSTPEKYVHDGQYGHFVVVGLNAKNRYGGSYVGEQIHHFMCLPNGSVGEINEFANGISAGFQQAGY